MIYQVCHSERSATESKNPRILGMFAVKSVRRSFGSLMLAQYDIVILATMLMKADNLNVNLHDWGGMDKNCPLWYDDGQVIIVCKMERVYGMGKKLRELVQKHWDVISYLFFGALTTVVNYVVYLPLYNAAGLSASVCNIIAWVAAVLFAYLTNKPFVFKSKDWSMKTVLPEFTKFVSCRLGSGLLETGIILVTVDWLCWNGNVMKLITSVLTVLINYVGSKWLVFGKK